MTRKALKAADRLRRQWARGMRARFTPAYARELEATAPLPGEAPAAYQKRLRRYLKGKGE